MWASKFLKGRNTRAITKTSIAAAASAPTSQAEFSANSQAFSVAVTELLECLDFVLDQLDDQGEHGDLLQFHLSRLAKEISKYENSKVNEQASQPWTGCLEALPGIKEQIYAHSGFLACAATLLPWLTEEIIRQVTVDEGLKDIVFTGHSAGGAVAAMVFLHFVCHCPSELSNAKFSLITFGAPPVTSTNITKLARSLPQTRHIYAVVNEHDLVPRVDQSYITSIISLYRAVYGLPLSDFNNTTFTSNPQADRSQDTVWKLPPPDFYVVGNVIVLRAKLDYNALHLQSTSSQTRTDTTAPSQKLDILRVSPIEFCKLLFFEISTSHPAVIYYDIWQTPS
ncbi:hypothetical protein FNAPI_1554 [Fusarium napiforme]|uniref:Fungal lipase-type domain-containing protein n=1 Tax=Fusarium napiforme TaxID=42672 RepID=A0A8H5NGD3_9HYPO|nr:hypothetical protein FNAPI_1554 [Fusarium napiforme]